MIASLHLVSESPRWRAAMRAMTDPGAMLEVADHADGERFLMEAAMLPPGIVLLDGTPVDDRVHDLLTALGRLRHRLITIMVTDHANIRQAVRAMKAGVHDLLEVPIAADRLLDAIAAARRHLEERRQRHRVVEAAQGRVASLSPREGDVLVALVKGLPNKAIAQALDLSPRTVEIHRARLMEKLEARSLSQVLRIAYDAGL